jgi:hypothetical protein
MNQGARQKESLYYVVDGPELLFRRLLIVSPSPSPFPSSLAHMLFVPGSSTSAAGGGTSSTVSTPAPLAEALRVTAPLAAPMPCFFFLLPVLSSFPVLPMFAPPALPSAPSPTKPLIQLNLLRLLSLAVVAPLVRECQCHCDTLFLLLLRWYTYQCIL